MRVYDGNTLVKQIPREEISKFNGSLAEPVKDFHDAKNPYPYGGVYRIVKFYNRAGQYIGESQAAIVRVGECKRSSLLIYKDLREIFDKIYSIKVQGERATDLFQVEGMLKDFELCIIKY